jgi:hypothetical protein
MRHPLSSTLWLFGVAGVFFATIIIVRWYANAGDIALPKVATDVRLGEST